MKNLVIAIMVAGMLLTGSAVFATGDADVQSELKALQSRVAELEAQQSDQAVQQRNAELIREMVRELADEMPAASADSGLTAGYDGGFFIKSADDQFELNFDTRLQFRHSYSQTDGGHEDLLIDGTRPNVLAGQDAPDASASAFELERVYLVLKGHLYKNLKFKIQTSGDDDSGTTMNTYSYQVSYKFSDLLGIQVGRYKAPFNRQETTSSGKQMLVDRSLANEVFNISRCTGVELFGKIAMGDVTPEYRIMMLGQFAGDNDAPWASYDNSPGVAARLVVPMMGSTTKDFANESDIKFHEDPVMQLGLGVAYDNDRDEDHFAGGESDAYEFLAKNGFDNRTDIYELGGECAMITADAMFKYQGLSVIFDGYYQHIDGDMGEIRDEGDFGNGNRSIDPVTLLATDPSIDGAELDNYGFTAQAGYFIVPKTFELVGRASGVFVDSSNDSYEYAGGWNWYMQGQDLKLSMDISYIDDLPMQSSSPNYAGVQNNGLFLIRTQLQFEF